nr:P3b, polyprotein [Andraeanum bacilliform virus]
MEYPVRIPPKQQTLLSSVTSDYRPPQDTQMGPIGYPPAGNPVSYTGFQPGDLSAGPSHFTRREPLTLFNLPSASIVQGAMLVFPSNIGQWEEVLRRWESITLNFISLQNFQDGESKITFITNLMGNTEKLTFIQWRTSYPMEYESLKDQALGDGGTQNVISQIRRIFFLDDAFQGTTRVQEAAYRDLEKLQCQNISGILKYLDDFKNLAAESGRLFVSPELSEKLWSKMPEGVGSKIKAAFEAKHPGNTTGVMPRIKCSYAYLEDLCKEAAFQRSLKKLDICRQIPIPGYYKNPEKKYGIRRSTTYRGKPHPSHARIERRKYIGTKKCKCYLCGEQGHYANECTNKKRDVTRVAFFENVAIPDGYDIVSVSENETDLEDIFSLSEGEEDMSQELAHTHIIAAFTDQTDYLVGRVGSWLPQLRVTKEEFECLHSWTQTDPAPENLDCRMCRTRTDICRRYSCPSCKMTFCGICSIHCYSLKLVPGLVIPQPKQKAELSQVDLLQLENDRLQLESQDMQKKFLAEISDLKEIIKKQAMKIQQQEEELFKACASQKKEEDKIAVLVNEKQEEEMEICATSSSSRNGLYNIPVQIEIDGIQQTVNAILDTGASTCAIDTTSVPSSFLMDSPYTVTLAGIGSTTKASKKLKEGKMLISGNIFRIPFTYAIPIKLKSNIAFIIGCNFIRSMGGGIRIEGNELTFYKNITSIQTQQTTAAITELDLTEDEYTILAADIFQPEIEPIFVSKNKALMQRLARAGYIGEDPLKYWCKNQTLCKLDIINPDLTIEDRPLKHITPALLEAYKRHTDALLQLSVIRKSNSRHRTNAMIVLSGTTIDPVTKKEKKGKERMVFNYKRLNDNTLKDQYSLPGINTIIAKVGQSKIYSKFDLKSGFHQVAMDPDSIEWTAFWVPSGLFEWLVMPFGLKNAPAIFQRKMDQCFKGTEEYIAVYIDDILIFSNTPQEHAQHLTNMLQICENNGLILSPSKMKIGVAQIDFLGALIGDGRIQLQENIISKIADFKNEELLTLKGLRSWLGILNYARAYIPNLGKTLGPLYSKTSLTGERRFNNKDWQLVHNMKATVKKLPPLQLPPPNCSIIIETDGCSEGWGGICKWKPFQKDSSKEERICAYASGKFDIPKSTIDAEIQAVINSLDKFKIYYLDKREVTIRSDCQAIISFYNKTNQNKPSRIRWMTFTDYITSLGIPVNFEHIEGKNNVIADTLSRLINHLSFREWQERDHQEDDHQENHPPAPEQVLESDISRQSHKTCLTTIKTAQKLKKKQSRNAKLPWDNFYQSSTSKEASSQGQKLKEAVPQQKHGMTMKKSSHSSNLFKPSSPDDTRKTSTGSLTVTRRTFLTGGPNGHKGMALP